MSVTDSAGLMESPESISGAAAFTQRSRIILRQSEKSLRLILCGKARNSSVFQIAMMRSSRFVAHFSNFSPLK
jgi:hypothetical protein